MCRYISRSVGVRQQRYCAAGICPGGAAAVIQHYHPSALAQRQLFKQTPRVLRNGKSRERRVGERKKQVTFVGSHKKAAGKSRSTGSEISLTFPPVWDALLYYFFLFA
jgi:hypothetical protein